MDDGYRQQQSIERDQQLLINRKRQERALRQIEEWRREEGEHQRPSGRDELVRRDLHREEALLHQRRQEQAHSQQGWFERLLEKVINGGGRRRGNQRR